MAMVVTVVLQVVTGMESWQNLMAAFAELVAMAMAKMMMSIGGRKCNCGKKGKRLVVIQTLKAPFGKQGAVSGSSRGSAFSSVSGENSLG